MQTLVAEIIFIYYSHLRYFLSKMYSYATYNFNHNGAIN